MPDLARTPTTIPPHLKTGLESVPVLPIARQKHRFRVLRCGLSVPQPGRTSVTQSHRFKPRSELGMPRRPLAEPKARHFQGNH